MSVQTSDGGLSRGRIAILPLDNLRPSWCARPAGRPRISSDVQNWQSYQFCGEHKLALGDASEPGT